MKYFIIIIILILGGITYVIMAPGKPGPLDSFVTCLKDKGATFYGAFWCPHCQAQKALFGRSQKLLPYVECSTPDSKGQTQICKDKNVTGYPTWEFKGGERLTGEITLVDLSEKTGCVLPVVNQGV